MLTCQVRSSFPAAQPPIQSDMQTDHRKSCGGSRARYCSSPSIGVILNTTSLEREAVCPIVGPVQGGIRTALHSSVLELIFRRDCAWSSALKGKCNRYKIEKDIELLVPSYRTILADPYLPNRKRQPLKVSLGRKEMKTRGWQWCLPVCLLLPAVAIAAPVTITIHDLGEGNPITTALGFDPTSLNVQAGNESFDLHGEYSSALLLGNGVTVTVDFNLVEPAIEPNPGTISDTLNIVFTGHTPNSTDNNNISVDMHFRSDTDAPGGLPPLSNGIRLTETGAFQNLTNMIATAGGAPDFNISVASDVVPEPSTWGLMLIGAGGLLIGGLTRRS